VNMMADLHVGNRVTVLRKFDSVEVQIATPFNSSSLLAIIAWGGFILVGFFMFIQAQREGGPAVFLFLFWLTGTIFAVLGLLWLAVGKNVLIFDHYSLTATKSLFGLGLMTKSYRTKDITNMRVAGYFQYTATDALFGTQQLRAIGLGGGPTAFDYLTGIERVAPTLDELAANLPLSILQEFL